MVMLATFASVAIALAAPAEPPQPQAVAPEVQARAVVTILSGAALRFSEIERERPETLREAQVGAADGSVETLKLIEFQ